MKRASTRRAMTDALDALDDRAKFYAQFAKGFAHGLAASGIVSDHIVSSTHTDSGCWIIDADGRRVWRRLP